MNRKIILLCVVLIGICAISHVSAADDIDIVALDNSSGVETQVMEAADVDESEIASDNDDKLNVEYRDIQERINSAKDGDIINLTGEYVCDYVIVVNKSVTIQGVDDGATIKYNGPENNITPFFYVKNSNVVLSNIKFIGGTFHFGGAITWNGDNGIIKNCQFIDNSANGENGLGGALLMYGTNCNLTGCTFTNNRADVDGGAVAWYGDGGTITNCKFNENEAKGDGARFIPITGDPFTAKGWGGALVLWANNCNIADCSFTNNRATNYGGAIGLANDTIRIRNCSFNGNSISAKEYKNYESGGAIFSNSFDLIIDKCTFNDNNADGSIAGAISLASHNTVKNSFFKGNNAIHGNDLMVYIGSTNITIESNNFVLAFKKLINSSVWGVNEAVLNESKNIFTKTKIDSRVEFVTGMIFKYGESGSVSVYVDGGSIGNVRVLNHPEAKIKLSGSTLTVSGLAVGTYTLRVGTIADDDHNPVEGDLKITVNKAPAVIKATKTTVALKKSGRFSVTIVDQRTGKGVAGMKVTLKIYTGKKVQTVNRITNSKGEVSFQTKKLSKGSHKVVVSATHAGYKFVSLTSSIKVVKQTAMKFKVKKKTLKDGASLTITVMNKKTKKRVNGVKVRLLIYTGSKLSKTVILKTKTFKKNKGIVGYSTNELSVGTHKVKIEFVDIKYGGNSKSSLKITSRAKKYPAATFKISGKV